MHNRLLQVAVSTQPAKVACAYCTVVANSVCPLYVLLQIELDAKRRPLRTSTIKKNLFDKSWKFSKGAAKCSTLTGGSARKIYVF